MSDRISDEEKGTGVGGGGTERVREGAQSQSTTTTLAAGTTGLESRESEKSNGFGSDEEEVQLDPWQVQFEPGESINPKVRLTVTFALAPDSGTGELPCLQRAELGRQVPVVLDICVWPALPQFHLLLVHPLWYRRFATTGFPSGRDQPFGPVHLAGASIGSHFSLMQCGTDSVSSSWPGTSSDRSSGDPRPRSGVAAPSSSTRTSSTRHCKSPMPWSTTCPACSSSVSSAASSLRCPSIMPEHC